MSDAAHVAARPRADRRRYVLAAAMMAMLMAAIEAPLGSAIRHVERT